MPSPNPSASLTPASPTAPSAPQAPQPTQPQTASTASTGSEDPTKLIYKGSPNPQPNASLRPPPESAEAGEVKLANTSAKTSAAVTEALQNALPPPVPSLPGSAASNDPIFANAGLSDDSSIQLPEIRVERERTKSWMTKLAATQKERPNFNYKRQILPDAIYRTQYDRQNSHLPRRVEREDYANLLFRSVSRNDVEAARSLLNAGVSPYVTSADGETPLAYAERIGANEVAQLLRARSTNTELHTLAALPNY
ncbi:MAG: hypothetical protein ACOYNL_06705 [Rickettsiales bacterium]